MERQTFLIAVDYYSGLFEVQDTTSTVAWRVITVLKSWFARHGIPITVMSDSGPPFNSEISSSSVTNGILNISPVVLAIRKVMQKLRTR